MSNQARRLTVIEPPAVCYIWTSDYSPINQLHPPLLSKLFEPEYDFDEHCAKLKLKTIIKFRGSLISRRIVIVNNPRMHKLS